MLSSQPWFQKTPECDQGDVQVELPQHKTAKEMEQTTTDWENISNILLYMLDDLSFPRSPFIPILYTVSILELQSCRHFQVFVILHLFHRFLPDP